MKSTTSLSTIHDDFGVWGIARQEGNNTPYILWDNDLLSQVKQSSTDAETYVPVSNAYWLSGYKYNFIAIAPYDSGITDVNFSQATDSARDALSFSYNISERYQNGVYDYDMMAAVAETSVAKSTTHPSQQNLTFWHIFSQINIAVNFKDADDNNTTGTAVLRLHNVDQDIAYTITSVDNTPTITTDEVSLDVTPVNTSSTYTVNPIVFNGTNDNRSKEVPDVNTWTWTLNIVPQKIEKFILNLDFIINGVEFKNYEIELFPSDSTPKEYGCNQKYNWNLTLSPKFISFEPTVEDWKTGTDIPGVEIK